VFIWDSFTVRRPVDSVSEQTSTDFTYLDGVYLDRVCASILSLTPLTPDWDCRCIGLSFAFPRWQHHSWQRFGIADWFFTRVRHGKRVLLIVEASVSVRLSQPAALSKRQNYIWDHEIFTESYQKDSGFLRQNFLPLVEGNSFKRGRKKYPLTKLLFFPYLLV